MTDSPINLPLPTPPKHDFHPLRSANFPVGGRLMHFIEKKMKFRATPDFKDNCDALDAIREQLRNTCELPLERTEQVSDYFHLLTTLLSGFDLTEQAAGIQFIWNNVSLYNIDFEICCMSYNLCLGLLNSCTRYQLKPPSLNSLVPTIMAAKSLIDKCQEHYQNDFAPALQSSTIDDVQLFITALYYQAQASVYQANEKGKKLAPQYFILASNAFEKTKPALSEYAKYYRIVAYMYRADVTYNLQDYGTSVACTREARKTIPTDNKVLKKMQEPFKQLYPELNNAFKPYGDKYVHENESIYFEPVPDFDKYEIPPAKAQPIKTNIDWGKFITPCSPFESTVSDSIDSKINDKLNNFKTEASRAIKDIEESLALLPNSAASDATEKYNELLRLRDEANNLSQQVSTVMGLKSNQISQRCPMLFQQFNQMKAALSQAAESDAYYETMLAKSQSLNDGLIHKGKQLEEKKDQINQILRQADIAAEEARKNSGSGMSAALEADQTMKASFDALANQLNPIFKDTIKLVREVKAEAAGTTEQYTKDMEAAKNGFGQAINCYTKLISNFNAILNSANQC